MIGLKAIRSDAPATDDLFAKIGAFLVAHHLSPEPGHYAFAYHVLRDSGGPLARAVASLTDGGIRLSRQDIEQLGGTVSTGAEPERAADGSVLVAQTQLQVESFATVMRTVHDQTREFGQDLAASADEIRRSGHALEMADIVEITGVMLQRVRATERRLEAAIEETSDLRAQLEAAQGSARRDPLTDLANRRALEEAFAAAPPGAPLCLAMCDVDHFKQVNDRFGHGVGDRVLKAIAQTLTAQCGVHLVARYGGEEFAVLFSGVELDEATATIEAARDAVAARRFKLRESDAPLGQITFSAGLGLISPSERMDVAFARVDRALYRAKAEGRDRVAFAAATGR